ncbi:MAG: 2-oxoglutarate ferredoxin oxidoreductase subunit alpha [Planctomycetaceae bacterium]|nr:2-oxoglutarate ferredoxin oxidoreductase subunit alpha [Planctomycetaceae bacterium]
MASMGVAASEETHGKKLEQVETVVVRFCGDSGDGMQLAGTQMTNVSAAFGNDVSTFPDFPAEIRAPAGSLAGVSEYQLCFSKSEVHTPGDAVDTLVVMNPAALKTNLSDLKRGGTLVVNEDAFDKANLAKARYEANPLDDDEALAAYRVHKVPMTRLTRDAVAGLGLSEKEADRCKNFFALGLIYWLYERDDTPTLEWVQQKFAKKPEILEANTLALKGGYNYGYSTESFTVHYQVGKAQLPAGDYRKMTGNEATAMGLATAARLAGRGLFYGGYPITPATDVLHELAKLKHFGVKTFQAEDEIAAMASIIGAAFAGELSVTATSGPGVCLKSEAMGLGLMTELPMVIVNVQRGGPSTGLPTKTEQSDLLLSMFGRNGDSPLPIVAARSPGDCFYMVQEAMRIAVEFMTPVIFLSDGYIANGAEPWRIPDVADLTPIDVTHLTEKNNGDELLPYARNENLARPWIAAGTQGLEHRIGGLEKRDGNGNVEYSPANHQVMTNIRAEKVRRVAQSIPDQEALGPESGELLVVSWGGTYGAIVSGVQQAQREGKSVALAHVQYLNPFPSNLGEVITRYKKVLVPELNNGQLSLLLRAEYLVDAVSYNKVHGKPFLIGEIVDQIDSLLED